MRKLELFMSFVILTGLIAGALTGALICLVALSAGMATKILYLGLMVLGTTAIVAYPAMKLLIYFDKMQRRTEEKAYEVEHAV